MKELNVVVKQKPGVIDLNYEGIKQALEERMDLYSDVVVNLENKADRKKDIATLRKVKTALDGKRKEVKTVWMQPYNTFEAKVKELMGLVDKPIQLIDGQVKELEDRERLKKKERIKEMFAELSGELSEWLVLDRIYNDKWENAAVTMKKIREEMILKMGEIRSGLAVLSTMKSDVTPDAIELYKDDLNLTAAMFHINQYEAQRAKIVEQEQKKKEQEEEARLQRERERIRQEERQRVQEEERIRHDAKKEVVSEIAKPISDNVVTNAKVTAVYTVSATDEELQEIEMAFDSLGITWSRKRL